MWSIVCSCIEVSLVVSGARTFVRYGILFFFLHQVPLAVSGAWNVFVVMHAVCSCIKVPSAVSGARIHGRHGVFPPSRCL